MRLRVSDGVATCTHHNHIARDRPVINVTYSIANFASYNNTGTYGAGMVGPPCP
jgi:hypothetical protein